MITRARLFSRLTVLSHSHIFLFYTHSLLSSQPGSGDMMELGRAGVGAGRWSCPFSSRMFGSEVFVLFFFLIIISFLLKDFLVTLSLHCCVQDFL